LYGLDPNLSLCAQYHPHLHHERLGDVTPGQKPKRVFVAPYGELWDPHVPTAWRMLIWVRVAACLQHRFYLLTKRPGLIIPGEIPDLNNLWIGISAETAAVYQQRFRSLVWATPGCARRFVSFEPVHGRIDGLYVPNCGVLGGAIPDWIIIGAQTGKDAKSVRPEWEWVKHLRALADTEGIPVFEKDNLKSILPLGEELRQEWPEAKPNSD